MRTIRLYMKSLDHTHGKQSRSIGDGRRRWGGGGYDIEKWNHTVEVWSIILLNNYLSHYIQPFRLIYTIHVFNSLSLYCLYKWL